MCVSTRCKHNERCVVTNTPASISRSCYSLTHIWAHFPTALLCGFVVCTKMKEQRKEMFYITTHSAHFFMVIWKEGSKCFI